MWQLADLSKEEGSDDPKKDVAEKRLVLETLSSFSRISKRLQVMAEKKGSVDVMDEKTFQKTKKEKKKKEQLHEPSVVELEVKSDSDQGSADGKHLYIRNGCTFYLRTYLNL